MLVYTSIRQIRYLEIAASLRARLVAGEIGGGDLLPSEAELAADHGVSRVTVRRALELLRDEGLVDSRQGYGWFVPAEPLRQSLVRLGTIEEQLAASGRTSERRVLAFAYVPTPLHAEDALRVDEVLEVRRLHLCDGEPFAYVEVWCPADLTGHLSRADVERESFIGLLGMAIGGATQTIGADLAAGAECGLLDVRPGSPVLRARRVARSAAGRNVLVSHQVFPAHRTEFVVDLPRSDGSMTATGLRLVEARPDAAAGAG